MGGCMNARVERAIIAADRFDCRAIDSDPRGRFDRPATRR
jgi:hypothetical protein